MPVIRAGCGQGWSHCSLGLRARAAASSPTLLSEAPPRFMPIPSPLTTFCPVPSPPVFLPSTPGTWSQFLLDDDLKGLEWILSASHPALAPLSPDFKVCQTHPCLLALSGSPCFCCHFLSPHWLPLQPTAPPSVGLESVWPYGMMPGPLPG